MPYIFVRCQSGEGSGETFIDFEDKADANVSDVMYSSSFRAEDVSWNKGGLRTFKVNKAVASKVWF